MRSKFIPFSWSCIALIPELDNWLGLHPENCCYRHKMIIKQIETTCIWIRFHTFVDLIIQILYYSALPQNIIFIFSSYYTLSLFSTITLGSVLTNFPARTQPCQRALHCIWWLGRPSWFSSRNFCFLTSELHFGCICAGRLGVIGPSD